MKKGAKSHLSLFLCRLDGADYLLRYNPTMYHGSGTYHYNLFYLGPPGEEHMVDSGSVEFDLNFDSPSDHAFPVEEIAAFMERMNGYLAQSTVLFNTDEHLAPALEAGPPLKDTLWWLDAEEGFQYDKTDDLADVLRAYQEYRESRVPSPGA